MIDITSSLDLGKDFTDFKVIDNQNYFTLRIIFTTSQITLHMKEDQMIELMKVLQDHFMTRAGFVPPVRYHGDGDPMDDLTPGEIITIEDHSDSEGDRP